MIMFTCVCEAPRDSQNQQRQSDHKIQYAVILWEKDTNCSKDRGASEKHQDNTTLLCTVINHIVFRIISDGVFSEC